VPIIFVERRHGRSKNSIGTVFSSMWLVSTLPFRG
jgi:hypothetical protein